MEIESEKRWAIETLEHGLANDCADDINEVLINLEDGACDYVELIPILQKVAAHETFYYFDDNGAGGYPRADYNHEASFSWSAMKAIKNIIENARMESGSKSAKVLKSNSSSRIKTALESLRAGGACIDASLIPILEKIERKNVYERYSYVGGVSTEEALGDLARDVIQMIRLNIQSAPASERAKADAIFIQNAISEFKVLEKLERLRPPDKKVEVPAKPVEEFESCSFCELLLDEVRACTGQDEQFPEAFYHLTRLDEGRYESLYRCPCCTSFFRWTDHSSWTGSGYNDYENLDRFPKRKSQLLDNLFSSDPNDYPAPGEVEEFVKDLSQELLLKALYLRVRVAPEVAGPFLPYLMSRLQRHDTSAGNFLSSYISDKTERAEEVLEIFRSSEDWKRRPLSEILYKCLNLTTGKS